MIRTLNQLPLAGKCVFIRTDYNVPFTLEADGSRKIADDTRIRASLPTLLYAIDQGARIIIGTHLGRPQGKRDPQHSLEPIAQHLALLLERDVLLAEECIGEGIRLMVQSLKSGQILLLENLRFYPGEEANDPFFAKQLSRMASVYVNDAFGVSHRSHASITTLPSLFLDRGMGFLIDRELRYLDPILSSPPHPFYLVLGGSKVSDKIKTIDTLMRRSDGLLIGGAMAHAFLVAQGKTHFLPEAALLKVSKKEEEAASSLLALGTQLGVPFILPVDTKEGFDIGPQTTELFIQKLRSAKALFWNGPLGWFENPDYQQGTFQVAQSLEHCEGMKIVGGGDTLAAIQKAGAQAFIDHASTGGGAALEYLEGHGLPGIDILQMSLKEQSTLEISEEASENDWEEDERWE